MAGKFKPIFLHDEVAKKMEELEALSPTAGIDKMIELYIKEFEEMHNHGPDPLGTRKPFCSALAGCVRNEADKGDDPES